VALATPAQFADGFTPTVGVHVINPVDDRDAPFGKAWTRPDCPAADSTERSALDQYRVTIDNVKSSSLTRRGVLEPRRLSRGSEADRGGELHGDLIVEGEVVVCSQDGYT